jgi:transcriptional regulator with XRE-family HTH domain
MNRNEILAVFAKNLKIRRIIAGYSQSELARMAGGITRAAISKYETGEKNPTLITVLALAKALGTTVDGLLLPVDIKIGGEEE